jgi:MFS family permease
MNDNPARLSTVWRIVATAAVMQSIATGLAFASFGTIMLALERTYHGTRQSSSMAIGLMLLGLQITSSIAGRLLERFSLRQVMGAGTLMGFAGFALASIANDIGSVVACYGLLIGPAAALYGPIACNTLVTRWVRGDRQGRAIGFVGMPFVAMIAPLAAAAVLLDFGVRTVLMGMAAIHLCMLPLIWSIREYPPAAGRVADRTDEAPPPTGDPLPVSTILGGPLFWLLAIGYGISAGAGAMKGAHFVPLLLSRGRTFDDANLLAAISAGAGVLGTLLFGWLADRIGAVRAIVISCLLQAVTWQILLTKLAMPLLMVDAIIGGAASAGAFPLATMVVVRIFGQPSYPRVYGMLSLTIMPFVFGMTPLAGLLYVRTGSYQIPFAITIGALIGATALLAILHPLRARFPAARMAAA